MVWDIPVLLRGSKEVLRGRVRGETPAWPSLGLTPWNFPFLLSAAWVIPWSMPISPIWGLQGTNGYCGFIQLIQRTEERGSREQQRLNLDVGEEFRAMGNPYFSYGYPASLFDTPCCNLGDCDRLVWRAFTYLVDPPSRMNGDKNGVPGRV